ncbi:MAG: SCP2 sterol-binding domain-containing protein [Acidobacteria bacterium]|nr:SCP2 sterol-binding domain-containing protein [Acidobacteriota bacterium]
MEPEVFTAPWAEAWCAELNASAAYREAAARWEGALVLVMQADPAMGIADPRSLYLDLHHGECRLARPATTDDTGAAPFVLEATPAVWKRVLEGRLDPLLGLMTGKVRLSRGSLAKLTPQVQAAKELVRSAARLATTFPPGWQT